MKKSALYRNMSIGLISFVVICLQGAVYAQLSDPRGGEPLFSFGVVADVQYADRESTGRRDYRGAISKLERALAIFNQHDITCVFNLGDIIDRGYESFQRPLDVFAKSNSQVFHVLGNHDFDIAETTKIDVRKLLGNHKGYFSFEIRDFVFIVLDGTDVSTFATTDGTAKHAQAQRQLKALKESGANNAYDWNGGIGQRQLNWVGKQLARADRSNKKVILFCHWPLYPKNGAQLWNSDQLLGLIDGSNSVVAYFAGHHHAGSYTEVNGVHYLTWKGIVEAQGGTTGGVVEVFSDKLVVKGFGDESSRVMLFSPH